MDAKRLETTNSLESPSGTAFSIYVHIPYCAKKCPYCDFNSYTPPTSASMGASDQRANFSTIEDAYTDALLSELEARSVEYEWQGRTIHSVFFGGGTPSLFSPRSIEKLLTGIERCFSSPFERETTLEANPGTIQERLGKTKLEGFRSAGVNRISMGVQSFFDKKLSFLGRIHSATESERAIESIRSVGFENFNVDLMFGVPEESEETWRYDLNQAISFKPTHISAYNLTIEPGTEFGRRSRKGTVVLAEEALQARLQLVTVEELQQGGYQRYEVSNYAKPGYVCAHNLAYWQGRDYLGIGAGAHSYLRAKEDTADCRGHRWSNIPKPEHYIQRITDTKTAAQRSEKIDALQDELEFFFTRLRTVFGISLEEYFAIFQRDFLAHYEPALRRLQDEMLIESGSTHTRLTPRGFLFADYVLGQLAKAQ